MAPGLGARLRHLARQFIQELEPIVAQYEGIRDAAVALEASVAEAFPEDARRRVVGRPCLSLSSRIKRERRKNKYLRQLLMEARHQVKDLLVGHQARKNRMTPEFLAKVSLS